MALLMLLIACVACSKKNLIIGEDLTNGKNAIVLSASTVQNGVEGPLTRAAIIDGQGKETAFEKHTRLTLLMVSENSTNASDKKYSVTYGLALGNGKSPSQWISSDPYSSISFNTTKTDGTDKQKYTDPTGTVLETEATNNAPGDGIIRYWNDAHERKSVLSIYGFAISNTILPSGAPFDQRINGTANTTGQNFIAPATDIDYKIKSNLSDQKWRVGNHNLDAAGYSVQNFLSLLYKDDLLYSNNLSNQSSGDGRLKYTSGHFDTGVLRFNRAMTMLSFKIIPGAGFDQESGDNFNFKEGTNVALSGFNKKGNLNIKTGSWENVEAENNVVINGKNYNWRTIANVTNGKKINEIDDHAYYLLALAIPGTDLTTANVDNAVTIIIDDNEYTISMQELYDAIHAVSANNDSDDQTKVKESVLDGGKRLKAGNNYEFNIVIAKTRIASIEAKMIPWEAAIATATASNSHVTLSLKDTEGTAVTGGGFSLYRAAGAEYSGSDYNSYAVYDWEKGYEGPAANVTESDSIYDTEWYWPDNRTFYHFRTLKPEGQTLNGNEAMTTVAMSGGPVSSATDYQWGAPFKSDASLGYSHTSGFCNNADKASGQLYKAIGATDGVIAITQLHMTSQVFVDLETSAGSDQVDLTDASVTLTNLATSANLQLGNGLVTGHGAYYNVPITADAHAAADGVPAYDYSYGVLPQKLSGNGNTTGVGNANGTVGIIISLTDGNRYIIENLGTVKANNTAVTTWDPGKKYYYRFKLTKTGIDPLYATIKDWEDVSANYGDIKIE